MVSRLVLVRHAKTQARDPEIIDKDRQLTRAGRCSIEARFPVSLQLLAEENVDEVKIWSSPALRAMQTAEVVARSLGIGGIEIRESLYADSVDTFMGELAEESGTLIVVGHNPFMEELYGRLSGTAQDMGTGAMASFGFTAAGEHLAGVGSWLEWFVQGPRVELWQSIADVEDGLAGAAKRIARRAATLLENPDDPEALHQYRISLRIARSLLGFVAPYCKGAPVRKTMRDIKRLQDPTSRVRELDMLHEALDSQAAEAAIVGEARTQLRAGFLERFAGDATQKELARVVKRIANVPWRRSIRQSGLDGQVLVDRVAQMRADYELSMAHVDYDDQEAVHDVRKEAKALRYVTREFSRLLPESAGTTNVRAKAVQDKLGELCDCWNNAQLVIEICGPQAVQIASRFVVRADEIVVDLRRGRTYGLAISDS
ncbi:MAG: CHAD domain-containing protein [Coriobacteriales bacterium]